MAKLFINDYFIEIHIERGNAEEIEKAMSIPYVHKNKINTKFKTTIYNLQLVLQLFRNVHTDSDIEKLSPVVYKRFLEIKSSSELSSEIITSEGKEHQLLYKHQVKGVELAKVNNRYCFFYDTRTGKTPMSLQIIVDDIKENPQHKWLVLCPLILIENAWIEDAKRFFPELSVVSLHATTKAKRLKQFEQKANLYILNIESFCSYLPYVLQLKVHGCIVDESSTMKSHKSNFAKAAVDFAFTVKRWYLLSGTPAPNGEYEYYMQLRSVDYFALHQSWSRFKEYFFINTSYDSHYEKLVINPYRKDELTELVKRYAVYVDKEDVLVTPGRTFIEHKFDLPVELKEKYDRLKKDLYYELLLEEENTEEYITAASAAAARNKLNQVTSGFIIDTEAKLENKILRKEAKLENREVENLEQEVYDLSDYRFNKLDELLQSVGNKQVLIWCHYRHEFEIIKERYTTKCDCIYGGVSIANKNDIIKRFKEGKIQYLVANPASADKGLTLTNAHIAIYFSLSDSYELFKQSMERIYGGIHSQKNHCTYYIMLAKNTIDEVIYATVMHKKELSIELLNHLKGG